MASRQVLGDLYPSDAAQGECGFDQRDGQSDGDRAHVLDRGECDPGADGFGAEHADGLPGPEPDCDAE